MQASLGHTDHCLRPQNADGGLAQVVKIGGKEL